MTTMNLQQWAEAVSRIPDDQKADMIGVSPGGAAQLLGISRQAVHQAIQRGTLEAIRVKNRGRLVSINIPMSSLDFYRRHHLKKTR